MPIKKDAQIAIIEKNRYNRRLQPDEVSLKESLRGDKTLNAGITLEKGGKETRGGSEKEDTLSPYFSVSRLTR